MLAVGYVVIVGGVDGFDGVTIVPPPEGFTGLPSLGSSDGGLLSVSGLDADGSEWPVMVQA